MWARRRDETEESLLDAIGGGALSNSKPLSGGARVRPVVKLKDVTRAWTWGPVHAEVGLSRNHCVCLKVCVCDAMKYECEWRDHSV